MADLFAKFAGPLPEALFLVRADGGIAAASPKALEVVGTQNIDGRSLCEFFAEPDETVKGFLRTCARSKALLPGALTLRGGGEQRAFRAEGAVVVPASPDQPALILLRLVPKQVSIARFHLLNAQIEAQAREIRRRKQSESALADQRRWLEVTLSSIGDAVIATDAAGRVSFVNPVAETLTGWRQSDARGKDLATVFRIVHEETGDRVENPVVKVLRDGHIVGLANHTVLIANDGAERPIDDSAAPIRGADGAIHGAVLVFRDITARKRAERERQQLLEAERSARRAAERASLMKDEFLATISHELRTPLSAILGWSQVLRLAPASGSDLQQGLEVIERNARAQKQIIEDLLDMSRIISGKIRLDVQQVDLVAVIENALETVRPSAEARCQRAVKSRPTGEMKSSHFERSAIRQHFPSTRFRLMETADAESSQDGDCRSDTTPTFVTLVPTEDRRRATNRPADGPEALGAAAEGANCRHFARRLRGVNCRPFAGVTGSGPAGDWS